MRSDIAATGRRIDHFKRHAMARQLQQMHTHGIDLVLDIGANTGQYAQRLRKAGYAGEVISFEPMAEAFAALARKAARGRAAGQPWQALPWALGAREEEASLAISGDSRACSLKPMLPTHEEVAGYFATVGHQTVAVRTLDALWPQLVPAGRRCYLKIDAQGAERDILQGAAASLAQVQMVQLELSIVPLYGDAMLLPEALQHMQAAGFTLVSVEYGFCHPETGQMYQMDGIFART